MPCENFLAMLGKRTWHNKVTPHRRCSNGVTLLFDKADGKEDEKKDGGFVTE